MCKALEKCEITMIRGLSTQYQRKGKYKLAGIKVYDGIALLQVPELVALMVTERNALLCSAQADDWSVMSVLTSL